ncbi:retrovirus-related Pol polyprotein from transposon 17.6 [Caerostris extrusa]|uniref:Retrovirus-related Pol polyprotein from transposon 17.6 n=1 Tax=Caerostris extrusa TaxID=172846 RepID=A0AAV4SMP5_CAEEX|nr:retrovirus-related Pol polyprotein from transposon 17.6 [Caerostris extrusa]
MSEIDRARKDILYQVAIEVDFETDDITLFLVLLERQLKLSKIPEHLWVSYLSCYYIKKKTILNYGEAEQRAFETLKDCLITPPALKQANCSKPYILRTDLSNYALGFVLLQGNAKTNVHPIEYANRLLTAAERNHSNTEREALAKVWALKNFVTMWKFKKSQ